MQYQVGVRGSDSERVAELYDEAFGAKFVAAIPEKARRLRLFGDSVQPEFAIGAYDEQTLVGLVGFHTKDGSLTGNMGVSMLVRELGLFAGARAAVILSFYERSPVSGELLMDGIAVAPDYRGTGIGTNLLKLLKEYASGSGYERIRLDVIDTNEKARRLYERFGFEATSAERFPYLRRILGFGGSQTMVLRLDH